MKILLLAISVAHAGWFSDFCERHLVANDPYQFEQTSSEFLMQEIAKLEIKEKWGTITRDDKSILLIMRREIELRGFR